MMQFPRNWMSIAQACGILYGIATATSVAVILLFTRDTETIGAGLLIPLFALPAIALYVIAAAANLPNKARHAVYWLLFLPMPIYMFSVAFFPSTGAASDGADHWAMMFAIPLLAAGLCAYLVDQVWGLSNRCR
jgi:hypothetical protein